MSFYNSKGKIIERTTAIHLSDGTEITDSKGLPVYSGITDATAVTPSDTVVLVKGATKGIYIGGAGNLSVVLQSGATITFNELSAGVFHPISAIRIRSTGTTATNIVAVY